MRRPHSLVCQVGRLIGLVSVVQNVLAAPEAVLVPVSAEWYGYDGRWSPVNIRVGSPPQWVSVFVSTAGQETWVIGTGGCNANDSVCRDRRGGLFDTNASTTWNNVGPFELGLNTHLNFNGTGRYGYDNIALDERLTVSDQIVGVVDSIDYLLGFLGLGVKVTNFTDVDKPSFVSSLARDERHIPSRSYGYTAGAHYRLKGVPASLTLGGFDSSRLEPHGQYFLLGFDDAPILAVNEITVRSARDSPGWSANPLTLLASTDAALFTVDSSTPYLWLPPDVCDAFAAALNLTYDDDVQLYTFANDSARHKAVVDAELTFTFRLGDVVGSEQSVDITLPYAAFDLELTFPYPGLNATRTSPGYKYFPLRRAVSQEQYTLGRAFLQEAYLLVDYDRGNFSVSQARFAPDVLSRSTIVSIARPDNVTGQGNEGGGGDGGGASLGAGAIAGIAVGAVAGTLIVAGAIFFCLRRRRQRRRATDDAHAAGMPPE